MLRHFKIIITIFIILLNIASTRDYYVNRQIIRRAMINDDSSIYIFIGLDDFSDHGSSEAAGYYGQNNYIIQSDSVSMTSSDLNDEGDGGMHISTNTITIYR